VSEVTRILEFIHQGFLYDAKLSGSGTASCASCHVDAEMDPLAWDPGDPNGKMEVESVVESGAASGTERRHRLLELSGQNPLHWRGDRTSFRGQVRRCLARESVSEKRFGNQASKLRERKDSAPNRGGIVFVGDRYSSKTIWSKYWKKLWHRSKTCGRNSRM